MAIIKIVEVGPRDGLQNETEMVPSNAKVAFVDALSDSGVSEIEVSAFVSPKMIPQLNDAATIFKNIKRKKMFRAVTRIRDKYGFSSIQFGEILTNKRNVDRDRGVRTRRSY